MSLMPSGHGGVTPRRPCSPGRAAARARRVRGGPAGERCWRLGAPPWAAAAAPRQHAAGRAAAAPASTRGRAGPGRGAGAGGPLEPPAAPRGGAGRRRPPALRQRRARPRAEPGLPGASPGPPGGLLAKFAGGRERGRRWLGRRRSSRAACCRRGSLLLCIEARPSTAKTPAAWRSLGPPLLPPALPASQPPSLPRLAPAPPRRPPPATRRRAPSLARAGWLGARLTARPPESCRQRGQGAGGASPHPAPAAARLARAPRSHVCGHPPDPLGPHRATLPVAVWGRGARTWWQGRRVRTGDEAHSRLGRSGCGRRRSEGPPGAQSLHRHRHPCRIRTPPQNPTRDLRTGRLGEIAWVDEGPRARWVTCLV